ncbi:hypothetical protein OUZ56_012628 [Daphnia magna]|uniref:Uncharacterized protein n=1 Tax=Daphnia magna TaxID=35525 RepID=A0ABQ9Z3L9_9CRUS|nr:hypothetical protein OUZ56_012628 [Daphnia magna]
MVLSLSMLIELLPTGRIPLFHRTLPFSWYGPYQQCYDALLKYTNPSENVRIEIMEISALHAELHNDGFV